MHPCHTCTTLPAVPSFGHVGGMVCFSPLLSLCYTDRSVLPVLSRALITIGCSVCAGCVCVSVGCRFPIPTGVVHIPCQWSKCNFHSFFSLLATFLCAFFYCLPFLAKIDNISLTNMINAVWRCFKSGSLMAEEASNDRNNPIRRAEP